MVVVVLQLFLNPAPAIQEIVEIPGMSDVVQPEADGVQILEQLVQLQHLPIHTKQQRGLVLGQLGQLCGVVCGIPPHRRSREGERKGAGLAVRTLDFLCF